jgi:cytochrome c2
MATFAEAPPGDVAKGEKIFKTKCAQCHVAEKGGGHKQVTTTRGVIVDPIVEIGTAIEGFVGTGGMRPEPLGQGFWSPDFLGCSTRSGQSVAKFFLRLWSCRNCECDKPYIYLNI